MADRDLSRFSFAPPQSTPAVGTRIVRTRVAVRPLLSLFSLCLFSSFALSSRPVHAADLPNPPAVKPEASTQPAKINKPGAAKSPASQAAGIEFFEKQVRPLLAAHCLECHSTADGQAVKGGLALDSRAGWMAGGESGPVIAPGDPDGSLLIEAVRYESLEMPPKGKLSAKDVAVLERWVKLGAPDPREGRAPTVAAASPATLDPALARSFWSFQPPEARRPPTTKNETWPTGDIDRFVLSKLESAGLSPSPDAAPEQWLRRVTYDLTGLPPTPDEQTAFLADSTAGARERVVDRLLNSTQFGVHWGRHWLDVARYADSNGSDFNAKFANAWRYRDYVIDAFNRDKPYDLFVTEQLAGDLMPAEGDVQRAERLIATTFLNVGPKMLSERDKEKLALDVVDEQLDTLGKAFLGMTLGCARCHDHKFDPIPTADYYAMAGILRSTVTLEGESQQYVSTWVETPLPMTPEHAASVAEHKRTVAERQAKLDAAKRSLSTAETKLASFDDVGRRVVVDDSEARVVGAWVASKYSPHFVGVGYLHDDKNGKGEKSITWTPDLPRAGKYEVRLAFAGNGGRADSVPVTIRHADSETVVKVDQSRKAKIDRLYEPLGVFRFEKGRAGSVSMSNLGTTGYVLADAVEFVPVELDANGATGSDASRAKGEANRDAAMKKAEQEIEKIAAEIRELEGKLGELKKQAPTPTPMAMAAREAPQIDDCRICIRGEVNNRGPKVVRGFLQAAGDGTKQLVDPLQSGRLELARWIVRPDNPLTARVMVNRIWSHVFGEGLVSTVDNFGRLGSPPSHPELLDTLSVEFVESGWSTKRLVRRLVLSHTYAQSTQFNRRAFEQDPENSLLWRARRKRLPAEAIRDGLLAAAGNLDLRSPAPAVRGAGGSGVPNAAAQVRSVFLPIIRNELSTFLTVFDFADPDVSTGRRAETNVPAQALFFLNDPLVRTQAAGIAERVMGGSNRDDERIEAAYRLILCRSATAAESVRAKAFLDKIRSPEPARGDRTGKDSTREFESWRQLAQAIVASTEFRLLD
jgi:hypothetical protein